VADTGERDRHRRRAAVVLLETTVVGALLAAALGLVDHALGGGTIVR